MVCMNRSLIYREYHTIRYRADRATLVNLYKNLSRDRYKVLQLEEIHLHNSLLKNKEINALWLFTLTIQPTHHDFDWNPVKIADRVERKRICPICKVHFASIKKLKKHKRYQHSY